jgi:hypothetical protein
MIEFKLEGHTPGEMLDIVKELRAQGMQTGVDFDFAYMPVTYDADGCYDIHEQPYTRFSFYNEKAGLIFTLKYL